jgi:hypothetical protein
MTEVKVRVVVLGSRLRSFNGKYDTEERIGVYGRRGRNSFAVPLAVDAAAKVVSGREKPVFVVDPDSALAQPVGKSDVDDKDGKLAAQIEVASQRRYVKALTVRVLDLTWALISMGCGVGLCFAALTLISSLTGQPITFGSS